MLNIISFVTPLSPSTAVPMIVPLRRSLTLTEYCNIYYNITYGKYGLHLNTNLIELSNDYELYL